MDTTTTTPSPSKRQRLLKVAAPALIGLALFAPGFVGTAHAADGDTDNNGIVDARDVMSGLGDLQEKAAPIAVGVAGFSIGMMLLKRLLYA